MSDLETLQEIIKRINELRKRIRAMETLEIFALNRLNMGTATGAGSGEIKASGDVFPLGDEAGIKKRLHAHNVLGTIQENFDVGSMPAGWSWGGSPFITPATVDFSAASLLQIGFSSTAGERAFLYKSLAPASIPFACVGVNSLTAGFQAGIRVDDGSDNNYVELYFRISSIASGTNTFVMRGAYRTGGGAVNFFDYDTWTLPIPPIVGLEISGTKWSSWAARPLVALQFGFFVNWKPTITSGLTWTPSRAGLIFDDGSGTDTWDRGIVDYIGGL